MQSIPISEAVIPYETISISSFVFQGPLQMPLKDQDKDSCLNLNVL